MRKQKTVLLKTKKIIFSKLENTKLKDKKCNQQTTHHQIIYNTKEHQQQK